MDKSCKTCLYDKVCPHPKDDDALNCGGYADESRFVKRPCDIGDTVYCLIDENNELDSESTHICSSKVEGFSIEKHGDRHMLVIHLDFWDTDINPRTLLVLADDCINNTVFIHLQDARKAISERRA